MPPIFASAVILREQVHEKVRSVCQSDFTRRAGEVVHHHDGIVAPIVTKRENIGSVRIENREIAPSDFRNLSCACGSSMCKRSPLSRA